MVKHLHSVEIAASDIALLGGHSEKYAQSTQQRSSGRDAHLCLEPNAVGTICVVSVSLYLRKKTIEMFERRHSIHVIVCSFVLYVVRDPASF